MAENKLKVLAIDDKPDNLTVLKAVVGDAFPGAAVFTTTDGRQGLELALARDPDVILLDIVMPQMDGYEVCQRLKADARLKLIPVVFLTATKNKESRIKALEAGGDGFLTKPLEEAELTAQIRAMAKIKAANTAQFMKMERLEVLVSERTRALEQELEERKAAQAEREKLMTAIDQAGEIILITDAEGNIEYANPAFEKITGYSRAEVLGKTPRVLKSGKQDAAFYGSLWGDISSGKTWERRMVNKRKDGTLYTEVSTISPVLDAAGRIVNYVAVKRDITEQLRLENQFLQSQKMEAVGVLAGGVAHDFNNILTAIKAYAGFIRKDLPPESPMRADAEEILTAADRAGTLTRQLLAFSRRQILAPRVVDMNKIVGDMTKMLSRVIGEDIKIGTELEPAPCLTLVDPGQLEQVVLNLAVNARDAMPKGGKLTLQTAIFAEDAALSAAHPDLPRGPLVCLKVRDTGTGMTSEVKARIFEPFYTTKEQGKGTGLGLSTVFGIVKQSGGEVAVSSEPGKGTTFFIYLPLAGNTVQYIQPNKDGRAANKTGSETVLLVEDDESLRRLGARILKSSGYLVLAAASGTEALTVLEGHGKPVDLLVTDVVMPGMTGRDLALEIARRKQAGRTLYMSGYTDEAIVKHGVLEPGIAFIYKPFTVEALALKLREVLDGPADQAKA